MNKHSLARVITTALAIFAMLFGSGNLMLPMRVGQMCGSAFNWGFLGFLISGVLLPLLGLITIIAYHGDYRAFFGRLGRRTGAFMIFYSMLAIGPLIVMPRIVCLSYTLLRPFLASWGLSVSAFAFACAFLSLAYVVTFRPTVLLGIIGKFLSPLKVASVVAIILIGLWNADGAHTAYVSVWSALETGMVYGYGTLDLLGAIFFGAIIVSLLRQDQSGTSEDHTLNTSMLTATYASLAAATLLGAIYYGMMILGAKYGQGLESLNEGALFSAITFKIFGVYGAAMIAITVFLACFTTTVSLATVVSNYIQVDIARGMIGYPIALAIVLGICLIPASLDLCVLMKYTLPVIVASYPIFIVITVCNFLHKLVGLSTIRAPFAVTCGYLLHVYADTIMTLGNQLWHAFV